VRAGDALLLEELGGVPVLQVHNEISNALLGAFLEELCRREIVK
jgi:hypothetical protein